jgi:hypothetical protein
VLAACFVLACGVAATAFASAPTTSTSAATLVTATSATLNGSADPGGEDTTGWFRYSTADPVSCDDSFGTRTPPSPSDDSLLGSGNAPVDYSHGITGLTPSTTYYYCAIALNGSGTSFGTVQSFTTGAAAPSVTTNSPTLVTETTAQLNGTANPGGDATTGWFRYNTTDPGSCDDSFGTRAPPTSGGSDLGSGTSSSAFSQSITDLLPDTTYYVCAIAENSVGKSFGSVQSFTTDAATAPTVTTSAATSLTATGATLNGSANPNGASSTGWFRYSTIDPGTCDDTFGTRTPGSGGSSLGSGTSSTPFSQAITGLSASTTYYFCAIASNSVGTSFGSVQSFTTSAAAPTVTTSAATLVNGSGARLNGTADPNGDSTTGWFRYSSTDPGTCDDTFGTRAPTSGGTDLGSGATNSAYFQSISGLATGTTYYFCAIAANSGGTSFGSVQSFTTAAPPVVTTSAATSVALTGATLNGAANPGRATTLGWFRYGTANPGTCTHTFGTRAPATSGTNIGFGSSPVSFSSAITGLTAGRTYYFCAVAQNSIGNSFGGVRSFTTPTAKPNVTTSAPTSVTTTTAQLNGAGNANGKTATGWFRYSTVSPDTCRDDFGMRAPGSGAASLGSGLFGYARAITGLSPGTTYYVCAIAANSVGKSFGSVRSFTTAAPPPPPLDTTPPGVSLGGKLRQKVGRRVRVTVTLTEDAGVRATGKVVVARSKTFRLTRVKTRQVAQGVTTTLAVRVPSRTLAAMKAALRRHKPVTAKITVIARDAAGNATTKRRKIKIRP